MNNVFCIKCQSKIILNVNFCESTFYTGICLYCANKIIKDINQDLFQKKNNNGNNNNN